MGGGGANAKVREIRIDGWEQFPIGTGIHSPS